jgi:selT/selW/selH-like putative selenoprotein
LAASIRSEFGVESKLIKGANGIFDVEVDGRRIFSKHQAGRFPNNEEVLALLRQ